MVVRVQASDIRAVETCPEGLVDDVPFGVATEQQAAQLNQAVKRSFDFVVATMSLLILLPLFIILVAVLLLKQGRPILIRHKRVGLNGSTFNCLKFRTMVNEPDALLADYLSRDAHARKEWAATHKLKNDPRVTAIGKVLRKSSMDELPQLVNIIKGDMSIVGPRPIVSDEVFRYGPYISNYYKVRPGLTGLWQVSGRSNTSYAHRVNLDNEYTQSVSLMKDLAIIAKTVPVVLRTDGSY